LERFLSEYDRGLLAEPAVMPSVDPYGLAATGLLFAPGAGIADLTGNAPDPSRPGQMLPSFYENISGGNYLDAGLQALGGAGDAVQMMGAAFPPALAVGAAMKAPRGIRAFHGSPYDFERFDISKIGTGEGAQVYGHGLYFAENPKVARDYRDELTVPPFEYKIGDKSVPKMYEDAINKENYELAEVLEQVQLHDTPTDLQDRFIGQGYSKDTEDFVKSLDYDTLKGVDESGTEVPLGRQYEVSISADPENFLDYQMPFSAQSKDVQEKLLKAGYEVDPNTSASGGLILSALMSKIAQKGEHLPGGKITDARRIASEKLKDAGVPGIKYLDLGSRTGAKSIAEASNNYVVFDDATIEIMRKYGLLAPLVGAGTVAAVSDMGEDNQGIMY
jgi:hypothetical protein